MKKALFILALFFALIIVVAIRVSLVIDPLAKGLKTNPLNSSIIRERLWGQHFSDLRFF